MPQTVCEFRTTQFNQTHNNSSAQYSVMRLYTIEFLEIHVLLFIAKLFRTFKVLFRSFSFQKQHCFCFLQSALMNSHEKLLQGLLCSFALSWHQLFCEIDQIYMLWFNFILGLIFISLCFKLIIIYYHAQKQREIKIKPWIKLNHNIYIMTGIFNNISSSGAKSQNSKRQFLF